MMRHHDRPTPMQPTLPTLGRRALLGGSLLGGTATISVLAAACSADNSADKETDSTSGSPDNTARSNPGSSPAPSRTAEENPADGTPRVLVAYFSRPGENYYYGDRIDLDVGNTEVLARTISRRLTELAVVHDVHRIEADDPYPQDYEETVARNVREQDADARPGVANQLASIGGYDVVLLGSPIWNVRPPMIMHTFAERYDFTGKRVHPFTTHAMSGLGTAMRDYAGACRGATLGEGLAVQGEEVRQTAPRAVTAWLDRIDLPGAPGKPVDDQLPRSAGPPPGASQLAKGVTPAPPDSRTGCLPSKTCRTTRRTTRRTRWTR